MEGGGGAEFSVELNTLQEMCAWYFLMVMVLDGEQKIAEHNFVGWIIGMLHNNHNASCIF